MIAVFYLLSVITSICPKTAGNIYNIVGAEKAVTVCYEKEYVKNPTNVNLYNLVQQSIVTNDYARVKEFCYTIPKLKKYKEFLRVGGSLDPVSSLKVADVDVLLDETYNVAFNLFDEYLKNLKSLTKEK